MRSFIAFCLFSLFVVGTKGLTPVKVGAFQSYGGLVWKEDYPAFVLDGCRVVTLLEAEEHEEIEDYVFKVDGVDHTFNVNKVEQGPSQLGLFVLRIGCGEDCGSGSTIDEFLGSDEASGVAEEDRDWLRGQSTTTATCTPQLIEAEGGVSEPWGNSWQGDDAYALDGCRVLMLGPVDSEEVTKAIFRIDGVDGEFGAETVQVLPSGMLYLYRLKERQVGAGCGRGSTIDEFLRSDFASDVPQGDKEWLRGLAA